MASSTSSSPPQIEVTDINVSPNQCKVSEYLDLRIEFSSDTEFQGYWDVSYIVDGMNKRYHVNLGTTPKQTYSKGANAMNFHADEIDTSGIKPSALSNAGILCASLHGQEDDGILDVKLVVNVEKDKGEFIRTIFNPLE